VIVCLIILMSADLHLHCMPLCQAHLSGRAFQG
jgi:hypothetical protein